MNFDNGHPRKDNLSGKLMVGLLLMILGVVFFLNNTHILSTDVTFRFWPAIILLLSLERFWNKGPLAAGGHVLLLVTICAQLSTMNRWNLVERWWPLGLIWLGVIIVLRALIPCRPKVICQDYPERQS